MYKLKMVLHLLQAGLLRDPLKKLNAINEIIYLAEV